MLFMFPLAFMIICCFVGYLLKGNDGIWHGISAAFVVMFVGVCVLFLWLEGMLFGWALPRNTLIFIGVCAALVYGRMWFDASRDNRTTKQGKQKQERSKYEARRNEDGIRNATVRLKDALRLKDDRQCRVLCEELHGLGGVSRALPLLELAVNDRDASARLCAIRGLQHRAIDSNDANNMTEVFDAMFGGKTAATSNCDPQAQEYNERAYQLLAQIINDSAEVTRNRVAATIAIGKGGHAQGVNLLLQLLHDREGDVRAAACNALGHFRADAEGMAQGIETIIHCLQDAHERVRREAAQALGELSDVRALKPLQMVVTNNRESTEVRQAAQQAVTKIQNAASQRH